MGGGARFRVGIALSAIGEGLREAARDFGGASLRCVCLPLSPAGSGHPPHRFITPSIGLFFWVAMLFRAMRGRLRREHMGNMPWLFFFAALAIPAFYAVGLLARPDSHFTTADFWRFWVVHLWVEDFLELFTT